MRKRAQAAVLPHQCPVIISHQRRLMGTTPTHTGDLLASAIPRQFALYNTLLQENPKMSKVTSLNMVFLGIHLSESQFR